MSTNSTVDILAELADGSLSGAEWDVWLAAHPEENEQVQIARRIRLLALRLRAVEPAIPADFERRLLARVRQDVTLIDMLDLASSGIGRTFIELVNALFGLLPQPNGSLVASVSP